MHRNTLHTPLMPSVTGLNTQAYVVPKNWDSPPSAANVRVFLKVLLIRHCGHCPNRLTACASVPRPLQDHLPPYAIPSVFCAIDCLPVNASAAGCTMLVSVFRGVPLPYRYHAIGTYPTSLRAGKLDRKKLPKSSDAPKLPAFHASDDYQRVVCACF